MTTEKAFFSNCSWSEDSSPGDGYKYRNLNEYTFCIYHSNKVDFNAHYDQYV